MLTKHTQVEQLKAQNIRETTAINWKYAQKELTTRKHKVTNISW